MCEFVAALDDVVLDVGIFGKRRCKVIPFVSFDLTPGDADALGVSKRKYDFRIDIALLAARRYQRSASSRFPFAVSNDRSPIR